MSVPFVVSWIDFINCLLVYYPRNFNLSNIRSSFCSVVHHVLFAAWYGTVTSGTGILAESEFDGVIFIKWDAFSHWQMQGRVDFSFNPFIQGRNKKRP